MMKVDGTLGKGESYFNTLSFAHIHDKSFVFHDPVVELT